MKKPLIILAGPTAVGKTKISIELARAVNGEIISADSMQVYRRMDIGSAKIRPEEMQGVRHYLIDVLEPDEDFHVARFQEMALQAMKEIYQKGKIPVLVGGTGFYIQAVLYGIDFTEHGGESGCRRELEELGRTRGVDFLHEMLRQVDEKAAEEIHAHNVKRVIRALEYYRQTGMRISEHNAQQRQKESPYHFAYFVLNEERDRLYERINQRVTQMLEDGLEQEVRSLKEQGIGKGMASMQGLGYKEMLDYLDGTCSLEEAAEIIRRDTRHFAKRQLTWFRREQDVIWINKEEYGRDEKKILQGMLEILEEKGIVCKKADTVE